jgi:hypothetical protein
MPCMATIGDVPLAWDRNGEPVELPATAVAWRVRRAAQHGKGGAPAIVWRDGQPLVCALETTVVGLRELVGDKPALYRLDAIDEAGKALANVPACYCNLGDVDDVGADSRDPLARTLDTVERLARVNAETMERLGSQLSHLVEAAAKLVAAADGAGIVRREPPVVAEIVEPIEPQPSPWLPVVESLAPHVPTLVQAGIALLASKSGAAIAAPPQKPANVVDVKH